MTEPIIKADVDKAITIITQDPKKLQFNFDNYSTNLNIVYNYIIQQIGALKKANAEANANSGIATKEAERQKKQLETQIDNLKKALIQASEKLQLISSDIIKD